MHAQLQLFLSQSDTILLFYCWRPMEILWRLLWRLRTQYWSESCDTGFYLAYNLSNEHFCCVVILCLQSLLALLCSFFPEAFTWRTCTLIKQSGFLLASTATSMNFHFGMIGNFILRIILSTTIYDLMLNLWKCLFELYEVVWLKSWGFVVSMAFLDLFIVFLWFVSIACILFALTDVY